MTTKDIAAKLAAYCRKGEFAKAHDELYADDIISIGPYATPQFEKETKGLKNIRAKGEKFDQMVDQYHSLEISEPVIAGNSFAFVMTMDITMKAKGRLKMPELCVYTVKDGKVVSEQFFM